RCSAVKERYPALNHAHRQSEVDGDGVARILECPVLIEERGEVRRQMDTHGEALVADGNVGEAVLAVLIGVYGRNLLPCHGINQLNKGKLHWRQAVAGVDRSLNVACGCYAERDIDGLPIVGRSHGSRRIAGQSRPAKGAYRERTLLDTVDE